MFKVFGTNVVVSKGFDNNPAFKFSENGESVRFRIGERVYDTRAEDNTRWVNRTVKAFGPLCERIKNMKLKEGSFINLIGRLDEDTWTDSQTNEKKSMTVIILDEIEYASNGGGEKSAKDKQAQSKAQGDAASAKGAAAPEQSDNFTGYEPFGGGAFFG